MKMFKIVLLVLVVVSLPTHAETYFVETGDSLGSISNKVPNSLGELLTMNPHLGNGRLIKPGQPVRYVSANDIISAKQWCSQPQLADGAVEETSYRAECRKLEAGEISYHPKDDGIHYALVFDMAADWWRLQAQVVVSQN